MGNFSSARRAGDAAARILAVVGGLLLAGSSLIAYFIAGYADDAIAAGAGAAEEAARSGDAGLDERTGNEAADWIQRAADYLVSGRPDQFQTFALIAAGAGAVAALVALVRRPDARWPEATWAAAALAGLVPNLAFDLWFSVWIFTGSLVAAAAVVHYLVRRDDHLRRAAAATQRAGTAAKPHVTSALATGYRAAGEALAQVRGPRAVAQAAPQPAPGPAAPAGWYADPGDADKLRYWDGAAWTAHVS